MTRTSILLVALALAAAAFAALPSAEAAMSTCTVGMEGCSGWICVDENGDKTWSENECTNKRDLDTCQYQSDCCSSTSGFWCPDRQ